MDRVLYARNEQTRSQINQVVNRAKQAQQVVSDFETQQEELQGKLKKEFELFKYRATVPQLYELMLSAMPNAENNPAQADLYRAYMQGDVERVKEIPRDQRKQIFVTNVSIFFSDDLGTAQFGETATMRKDAMMRDNQMMTGAEGAYDEEMMATLTQIYGDRYMAGMLGTSSDEEKEPGFVVSIVGYTPYHDIMALLDPTGVEDQPDKWGFVTRLDHMDEFMDANSPFELYSKDSDQFRLEKGAVDLETDFPLGIGESEFLPEEPGAEGTSTRKTPTMTEMMMSGYNQGFEILVDPVTGERIDAEPVRDFRGNAKRDALGNKLMKNRDSWFTLDFKLKWDNAPDIPKPKATTKGRR